MKMHITKQVPISTEITPYDMGQAFAYASNNEQIEFLEAVAKEFACWGNENRNAQLCCIADSITKHSYRKEEIKEWLMDLLDFIKNYEKGD